MKLELIQSLANRIARRAGYAKATTIRPSRARKFGCKVARAAHGYKGPGGRWVKAICEVVFPATWLEPESPPRLGKPSYLKGVKIPTDADWRRFHRYRKLEKHNGHKYAYAKAYGIANDNAEELMAEFIAAGVLKVDYSAIKEPKPRKVKNARGVQLWLPFWNRGN